LRVVTLSQLCMNCAVAGQWGQAHAYAVQAMALRESLERAMILLDFSPQYETEAFLRGGDERQARAEVQRLGESLRPSPRFRLPYLQSVAVLSAWEGHHEQAIGQLRQAAELAAELGLPAEQWQIQVALGTLYEARGEPAQAHTAFAEAARIIGGLAEGITDEARRARFLAGPQILPVLQHVQSETSPVSQDQAEPSGR
jgi:tetratricopeptide (TPR) repeat protein